MYQYEFKYGFKDYDGCDYQETVISACYPYELNDFDITYLGTYFSDCVLDKSIYDPASVKLLSVVVNRI